MHEASIQIHSDKFLHKTNKVKDFRIYFHGKLFVFPHSKKKKKNGQQKKNRSKIPAYNYRHQEQNNSINSRYIGVYLAYWIVVLFTSRLMIVGYFSIWKMIHFFVCCNVSWRQMTSVVWNTHLLHTRLCNRILWMQLNSQHCRRIQWRWKNVKWKK